MTARLLTVSLIALPCILGAHLTALLLAFAAVLIVTAHLLPVIATVTLVSATLILIARICLTLRETGFLRARSYA